MFFLKTKQFIVSVIPEGKKQSKKVFIFVSSKEADLRWWGACCYSYRWGMMYRPMIQDSVMKFMRLKFKGTKHCTIVCGTLRQANKTCC